MAQLWDRSGVLHCAGREIANRFELMSTVQRELGLDTRVVPVRDEQIASGDRRPKRLVLRRERQPIQGPGLTEAVRHWAHGANAAPPLG